MIDAVEYDENTKEMTVSMVNGHEYVYQGVPQSMVNQFVNAPSAGKFYNQNIKGAYGR